MLSKRISIKTTPDIRVSDDHLKQIAQKIILKERLDLQDGLDLYNSHDLLGIGSLANYIRTKRHGKKAFFIHNQHINYTNICTNRCHFCAYGRDENDGEAFTLSILDIKRIIEQRVHEPVREFHIVGGLNKSLPFDYYTDLIKTVKKIRPESTVKAFTAVEIDHLSKISNKSIEETIDSLKEAGLEMMPGGGAEVMSHRIRSALFPNKIDQHRWLEISKAVHRKGITTNATMLYGHVETKKERINHLIKLRDLQDETKGFSAFIPLSFHSKNTKLSHLGRTTAQDDLKTIAIARLILDNFNHIKAYWVMIGEPLAQIALHFGADDLDGTIIEEKISHMAGATTAKGLTHRRMKDMITRSGFIPVERDSFYHRVS